MSGVYIALNLWSSDIRSSKISQIDEALSDLCPSEEVFTSLLAGELDPDARRALDLHLDRCAACTQLIIDLAEFSSPLEGEQPEKLEPSKQPTTPSLQIGERYTIMRMIGRGGMGSVYEAFDKSLGRKVAIKVLRADLIEPDRREEHSARLLREARLLAAVYHPNVLNVYDVGVWNEQVFMAIQYIEGTTLGEWIRSSSPDWRNILEIYLKVGDGLAEAHKRGLVHRDIKPENILIDSTGRAWLADFGLACAIGGDVAVEGIEGSKGSAELMRSAITHTGAVIGTPAYMAPEQHLGARTDERTDQFSFAAAIFESLYHTRAFAGRTRQELKTAVCEGQLKPCPSKHLPTGIYRVLRRALKAQPAARYDSLPSLLSALRQVAEQKPLWRRLLRITALASLTLAALVGLSSMARSLWNLSNQEAPALTIDGGLDAQTQAKAPPTAKERAALEKEKSAQKNRACKVDPEACLDLVQHLQRYIFTEFEGLVTSREEQFRIGSAGLADRFLNMCDEGVIAACSLSAFAYTFSFHNYSYPERDLIPRFVKTMQKACEGGDPIGCFNMQDTYADGNYEREEEFSIKSNEKKFISIVKKGCEAGSGQSCWILAESLFSCQNFKHNQEKEHQALEHATLGCSRGWAQACLLAGLIYRDIDRGPCALEIQPLLGKIPDNDLFDYTASWSDVGIFCARFEAIRDDDKAHALFKAGCNINIAGKDKFERKAQDKSKRMSCSMLKSMNL